MRRAVARCFVTRDLPGPALGRLRERHEVDVWPERLPPPYEELRARTAEAEGLLSLLTDRVDAALIEGSPQLRAIANYAVGYDNIDLDAARARGIAVGNTPDVLTDATADLAFALLLAAARRLPEALLSVQSDDWVTWEPAAYLGHDVHGATLGIIGMGRIGRAVARRAEGFDMTVLHTGSDGGVPLLTLLKRSDFVSLHCPLTPATHHLIDSRGAGGHEAVGDPHQHRARADRRPGGADRGPARGRDRRRRARRHRSRAAAVRRPAAERAQPDRGPPHRLGHAHRAGGDGDLAVDNLLAALDGRPMPHPVHPG